MTRWAALGSIVCGIVVGSASATPIPPVEFHRLSNGLEIILRHDPAVPLVTVRFQSRAGSQLDPVGKEGLATLTAKSLRLGAGDKSQTELDNALATLGAKLSARASGDLIDITSDCPTIDRDAAGSLISLVAALVRTPTFPEPAVTRAKTRQLADLQAITDKGRALANRAFRTVVFAGHPHSRPRLGTVKSVSTLTRADLIAFHYEQVRPDNSIIAVAGDFDPDTILAQLESEFGGAFGGPIQPPVAISPAKPSSRARVILIDTGNASLKQVQLRVGGALPYRWSDPQQTDYLVAAEIMGGDFSSRLNTRLRVKEGLTYGARWVSQFDDQASGGAFMSTYTSPKKLARALTVTFVELERLKKDGFSEAERAQVVGRITLSFGFRFETPAHVLKAWLRLWRDGLKASALAELPERISATTVTSINAARGPFDPDRITIVAVGNAATRTVLSEFATSISAEFEVIPISALGLRPQVN